MTTKQRSAFMMKATSPYQGGTEMLKLIEATQCTSCYKVLNDDDYITGDVQVTEQHEERGIIGYICTICGYHDEEEF